MSEPWELCPHRAIWIFQPSQRGIRIWYKRWPGQEENFRGRLMTHLALQFANLTYVGMKSWDSHLQYRLRCSYAWAWGYGQVRLRCMIPINNIAQNQMLGKKERNKPCDPQVGWKCHQQHLCCGQYNRNMTIGFYLEIHTTDQVDWLPRINYVLMLGT